MDIDGLTTALLPLPQHLPVTTYAHSNTDGFIYIHGKGLTNPHSYRGVYAYLALEPTDDITTVADVLTSLTEANGSTYQGWKGGDYTMNGDTAVYVAEEGTTGMLTAQVMVLDDRVLIVCAEDVW